MFLSINKEGVFKMKKSLLISMAIAGMVLFSSCVSNEVKTTENSNINKRFQSVDTKDFIALQEGENKLNCPECGMKLPMFFKTNHAATVNGKVKQYCSIHCLADDKHNHKSQLTDMKVVAVDTLKFINVKDAIYVVGSEKKGTMSGLSKYAFEGRMSARRFADKYQGRVMNFDEAYEYALKDFSK
jgi:hypothetical protein